MSSLLFSEYKVKNVTLKNRIVMSPMCMYCSTTKDGRVTDWHVTHYESRAVGQVGLVFIEAILISEQGMISDGDLGIWDDKHIEGLQRIVSAVHAYGAKVAIQLAHGGGKAIVEGEIIAPSAIPFDTNWKVPKEMTISDILETIELYKAAAIRAKQAGADILEIHAAHGYLINEFLSPLTNKRKDQYGGSIDNRYRFLSEVIEAVKSVWDGPLFVRISSNEYHPDGTSLDTFIYYAKKMKEQGIDLIDCSSGGVVPAKINVYPGYQVPYAEKIKLEAEIPTAAVGLITSGLQAEEILRNERADLVFIGRELLRNPYWPYKAAKELGVHMEGPEQYKRAWIF